ncbi:MAG: glycosyltransferase family A protein [Pirellulaceae bacterium]|nr:glycosyltransferase family A protein [Pirellulaceae bacterium]
MTHQCGVSCVVAAYNAERYVAACIASLQRQRHANLEIIVVDDGSSDQTREIVEAIAKRDSRIQIISISNSKQAAARNLGVSRAKYDFIAFLDADDIAAQDRIEKQLAYLSDNPQICAVGGGIRLVDDQLREIGYDFPPEAHEEICKKLYAGIAAGGIFLSTAMVRRSSFEAVKGFRTEIVPAEDYDLWLRFADAGERLGNIPNVLSDYRVHLESDSSKLTLCQLKCMNRALADSCRRRNAPFIAVRQSGIPVQPLDRIATVLVMNGKLTRAIKIVFSGAARNPLGASSYVSILRLLYNQGERVLRSCLKVARWRGH